MTILGESEPKFSKSRQDNRSSFHLPFHNSFSQTTMNPFSSSSNKGRSIVLSEGDFLRQRLLKAEEELDIVRPESCLASEGQTQTTTIAG